MAQSAARSRRNSYRAPIKIRDANITDLTQRELFDGIQRSDLEKLIQSARVCSFEADRRLLPADEPAKHTYVIIDGTVVIWSRSTFDGHKETFLAWRGKEDILFETFLAWRGRDEVSAANRPNQTTPPTSKIVTCTSCDLLEIENQAFNEFTKFCPLIFRNLARLLVKKMSFERLRSEVIEAPHADQRIARALVSLAAERCGTSASTESRFKIPGVIKQSDLAGYVGYSTTETNRNLVTFRNENIIEYSAHSEITVLDSDKLRKIAKARLKSARKPKP